MESSKTEIVWLSMCHTSGNKDGNFVKEIYFSFVEFIIRLQLVLKRNVLFGGSNSNEHLSNHVIKKSLGFYPY